MGGFLPSRRRFLGGAGAVVGLPFLESALPRSAWGQAGPTIKRFMPVFFPNGVDKRGWPTAADGANWNNKAITQPLTPVKSLVGIWDGIGNPAGFGSHERAIRSFLTCQHTPSGDTNDGRGTSVDQVIAGIVGSQTRIPSLQLGMYSGTGYADSVWRAAGQPLPALGNPQQIFDKVFAGFEPNVSATEAERRLRYEASVLDYVAKEIGGLTPRLGRADKIRMDAYLTDVRELEKKIQTLPQTSCALPASPGAASNNLARDKKWELITDLAVAALACDATRVITLLYNGTNDSYSFLNIAEGHHDLSHWGSDVSKRDKTQRIDVWEFTQVARLVQKLAAIDEGGKSLLFNSFVFASSEIDEGDGHGANNLPFVAAGRMGGVFPAYEGKYQKFRGGSLPGVLHTSNGMTFGYDGGIPQAWVYVSAINGMGGNVTQFGADVAGGLLEKNILT